MAKCKRFKPRYTIDEEGKNEIKAEKIIELLEQKKFEGIPLWRSWYDPMTGRTTEPKYYMVALTASEEGIRPMVEFRVPEEYSITGEVTKWKCRGTVAQSSFKAGRDCIGCEGERYTEQKHFKIKEQLYLASPKARNHRLRKLFISIKNLNS